MYSKITNKKQLQEDIIENVNIPEECSVSKASNEIMLDRFCNGKEIDFPFADN